MAEPTDAGVVFRRARKPEERTIRRSALLAAAAALFDAEGPSGAGLNAIAARAGFTKSNVYRYFENREDVLLSLFLEELGHFATALEAAMVRVPVGEFDAVAKAASDCFLAQPRFCHLLSIITTVLERNVSSAAVMRLKRSGAEASYRAALALQSRLPGTRFEDCLWAAGAAITYVAGLWPSAHPAPAAAEILALPDYVHMKPVLERDLPRAIAAFLRSSPP